MLNGICRVAWLIVVVSLPFFSFSSLATTSKKTVPWLMFLLDSDSSATGRSSAFFYQTVAPSASVVRAGVTTDGKAISTYDVSLVNAKLGSTVYGDPTFSLLSNGRWAMTAEMAQEDTRGNGFLYHEASCPQVVDADAKVIVASSASSCLPGVNPAMSKNSQIFEVNGSNYMFSMSGGEIYLNRLTDATRKATDLQSICVRKTAVNALADLAWGESTLVLKKMQQSEELLLSDTAIARRKDGTWVLFVKGIPSSIPNCSGAGLCQLCNRGIYRTTSSDLITWAPLEKIVSQASVPDSVTYPDGSVWLYYQNFSEACAANDLKVALRAPISAVYESGAGNTLTSAGNVKFSNESFETNTSEHYPTNGNPIALPDAAARSALDACMGTSAK